MKISITETFKKRFKKLLKKNQNLIKEYEELLSELKQNTHIGIKLKENLFKIRLKGLGKGKRGGYRIIYYIKDENEIVLIIIYAKNEISNIQIKEIEEILKKEL